MYISADLEQDGNLLAVNPHYKPTAYAKEKRMKTSTI